ncbi:MAG: hypothetical protein ACYDH1_12200 [Anaerolineaceae bacterium]
MKKITIALSLFVVIAIILLTILFSQNKNDLQYPLSFLTPKETAVRHAKGMTVAGYHIEPNTVEAIQQVEINDMVLVLVQYSGHRIEGDVELCEMILEIEKKLLNQWEAKGGSGLCHEINDPDNTVPISIVSSYGATTFLERGYSTAFGYLRNEQITKVMVTWEDGLVESANVSERTYLTAREGGFHVEKIETYNDLGEIIFETHYPNTEGSNP